ncbi:MAG TPA: T9SS type A sorting domain-containing protein [Flavobacteriaceae bacterium]|nr:T9SS type A sorting domain-containing protein [Flavobacteriaceae bacterium]
MNIKLHLPTLFLLVAFSYSYSTILSPVNASATTDSHRFLETLETEVDANSLFFSSTTWDGNSWSNGTPNINLICIIDGNYTTSTHGSFEALELQVNAGYTLTISNNTYCKIAEDVTVAGNIQVENKGAFVQVDETGTFTLVGAGTSSVNKYTTPLENWYNYTYWSSPVSGTTVNQAFAFSHSGMRYWFDAEKFLDVLVEINNEDSYHPGHDDIDDDGDDWTLLNGATVLQPGVGYAATHSPIGFVSNNSYQYNFVGPLNTGNINVSIYFNGNNGDNDWNFIGNPYPSAISADEFFSENSAVVGGAIYLWSHASSASSSNSGNEAYNFNADDYAIINAGSGEVAGGSTVIPNRYIPSGQGFFVQGLTNGTAKFTNDMRVADTNSNSQFFRQNNTEDTNKLWINLTSDNGVFNQILVAYVDGATNEDDGNYYDAPRNLSGESASIIYTQIENVSDKKFAIQGKAPEGLTIDEKIPVGFFTSITEATLYTLSIAKIQGDFLTANTVLLKDNLYDTYTDLTLNDYTFTSETGDFTDRFEIVFSRQLLSVASPEKANAFSVFEPDANTLVFKTSGDASIHAIVLFDMNGKTILNHINTSHADQSTVSVPSLSTGNYIAKVTFSNGSVATKKILKKR